MADSPEAIMSDWKGGWTFTLIKLCIVTVLLFIGLILMFSMGNLKEITENFPKYRCNPMIMPFASNFGYDTKTNFDFCLQSIFNTKAAEVFGPVYKLLAGFMEIVKLIVDVALGIRKLFSNFLLGMNNFVRNVRDRIQSLLFNIRMSFLKINNLMGRVYGTMYAVIWMGVSAMTAGFNVSDNSLVNFIFEFCFDPNTPIQMADGSFKPLSSVQIGDTLAKRADSTFPVVTSVLRFHGIHTPMVNIRGVIVSGSHYVHSSLGWIPASAHPEAVAVNSIPQLICLNVTGHAFHIGYSNLLVSDYDEHSTEKVVQATQTTAIHALNSNMPGETVEEYSLGIDPNIEIRMADNTWKPVSSIKLGEKTWNSGTVVGVVCELCDTIVYHEGVKFASAQTMYNHSQNQWIRAGILWPESAIKSPTILYSLVTDKCGTIHARYGAEEYFLRDYREVPLLSMEEAYENEFLTTE